jgi:CDP-glucose 4,6-dehydratase
MASIIRAFEGKRVFITGHTGFKGSWLSEWLLGLGAEVWGYGLPPPTQPALFNLLRLDRRLRHQIGDVCDAQSVARAIQRCRPHFLFHLAAQPIVRTAYARPVETWATNVMGTVNVLDALRGLSQPCAAVMVTTDKVYANASPRPHREDDPLGGLDPYSASKAGAEVAVGVWRASYFSGANASAVATVRAGNVIGGGDWGANRLVPDCVKALGHGETIVIRNPDSIRPWQHVLDPLQGYLLLAAELGAVLRTRSMAERSRLCGGFNFGPAAGDHRTTAEVVEELLKNWQGRWRSIAETTAPREESVLRLDAGKARRVLGWRPRWRFATAIAQTVVWYREASPKSALELTRRQIMEYCATARPSRHHG